LEPAVDEIIGFMNGLALAYEHTSKAIEQSSMYNGCQSERMVNEIFNYVPDDNMFVCMIDFPGS
jgi:hypothetical protein